MCVMNVNEGIINGYLNVISGSLAKGILYCC